MSRVPRTLTGNLLLFGILAIAWSSALLVQDVPAPVHWIAGFVGIPVGLLFLVLAALRLRDHRGFRVMRTPNQHQARHEAKARTPLLGEPSTWIAVAAAGPSIAALARNDAAFDLAHPTLPTYLVLGCLLAGITAAIVTAFRFATLRRSIEADLPADSGERSVDWSGPTLHENAEQAKARGAPLGDIERVPRDDGPRTKPAAYAFLAAGILVLALGLTIAQAVHARAWVGGVILVAGLALMFTAGSIFRQTQDGRRAGVAVVAVAMVTALLSVAVMARQNPDFFRDPEPGRSSASRYEYRAIGQGAFDIAAPELDLVTFAGASDAWTSGPEQVAPPGTDRVVLFAPHVGLQARLLVDGEPVVLPGTGEQALTFDGIPAGASWRMQVRHTDPLSSPEDVHATLTYEQEWEVTCTVVGEPAGLGEDGSVPAVDGSTDASCEGELTAEPAT